MISMTGLRERGGKFFAASNGTSGVIVLITRSGHIHFWKMVGKITRPFVGEWPHRAEWDALFARAMSKAGYVQDRRCKQGWRWAK